MNQTTNFVQVMRLALAQEYMAEFRQRLEAFERLLEMHDNSKVSGHVDLGLGDSTVYEWLKSYVHSGIMIPNHKAAMSAAIDYIERLDENACYICHEAMMMEYESPESFITSCTNCHMPICSACVITATKTMGKCPACDADISNVWLSADHYTLKKSNAADFIYIDERQLAERNYVFEHDNNDDEHNDYEHNPDYDNDYEHNPDYDHADGYNLNDDHADGHNIDDHDDGHNNDDE